MPLYPEQQQQQQQRQQQQQQQQQLLLLLQQQQQSCCTSFYMIMNISSYYTAGKGPKNSFSCLMGKVAASKTTHTGQLTIDMLIFLQKHFFALESAS
jgi:hypothetical protein